MLKLYQPQPSILYIVQYTLQGFLNRFMDKADILKKIIAEGNCDWAVHETHCSVCPLSKLSTKPDGNFYSCYEAIVGDELVDTPTVDLKYLEAAERALLELEIEAVLEK